MKKNELNEMISKHREVNGNYWMDSYFRELVFKRLDDLCKLEIEYGLVNKEKCLELLQDLRCIIGLEPVVEAKRILVIELYSYATGLECNERWFEHYRDELEIMNSGYLHEIVL